jgi:hypothetical protein
VAQSILGSAGVKVVFANPDALADPDDERELFVATWCAHPDLIPDEVIMAVSEPEEEHDGGSPLYLRPHEVIHDEVPAAQISGSYSPAGVPRLAHTAAVVGR